MNVTATKMGKDTFAKHKNCEVYVDFEYQPKKRTGWNKYWSDAGVELPCQPALICKKHNVHIKWLNYRDAVEIQEVLDKTK
jgi:hypothetical protein